MIRFDRGFKSGRYHETMILLNGGMQKDLQALVDLLTQADDDDLNDFPWADFREAEEALNGALTNVSIVLPERIFKYSFDVKSAIYAMGEETQSFQLPNGKSFQWRGDTLIMTVPQSEGGDLVLEYNRFEIRLMEIMAGLKLMS